MNVNGDNSNNETQIIIHQLLDELVDELQISQSNDYFDYFDDVAMAALCLAKATADGDKDKITIAQIEFNIMGKQLDIEQADLALRQAKLNGNRNEIVNAQHAIAIAKADLEKKKNN